jgi:hypothetical protein
MFHNLPQARNTSLPRVWTCYRHGRVSNPMIQLPTVCNQCEDENNLVTEENGVSLTYPILQNVQLTVVLHNDGCAAAWCTEFGLNLPGVTSWASRAAKA